MPRRKARFRNGIKKKRIAADTYTRLPKLQGDFQKIAFELTYLGFLERIQTNCTKCDRVAAEDAWTKPIKSKWMAWVTDIPKPEKKLALDRALAQIRGTDRLDVEAYWKQWETTSTKPKDYVTTGLRIPEYSTLNFQELASTYNYGNFLHDLADRNGRMVERERAEEAWKDLVRGKWHEWKSNLSRDEKEKRLELALAQINGPKGDGEERIDNYWRSKANGNYRPEEHAREAVEQAHSELRVGKKEKKVQRRAVKVRSKIQSSVMKGDENIVNNKEGRDGIDDSLIFDFSNMLIAIPTLRPGI